MCGAIMICVPLLAATAEKGSTSPTATGLGGAGLEGGDEGQESTQPSEQNETSAESGDSPSAAAEQQRWFQCPLCSEKFPSQDLLESHAMSVHSVNSEGLQRLHACMLRSCLCVAYMVNCMCCIEYVNTVSSYL